MKKKNNFSVLISVYKKENPIFFREALYSIVNQTLMPSEIVLVEDGKLTKELYDVVNDYKNQYSNIFKIVKLKENQGLAIALNKGLNSCSYDYVARMDSDDYSVSNRFEKEMNLITKKCIDVVGSNILEFDEKMEHIISERCVPECNNEIKKYAKKRNPVNHVSVMFKKSKVLDAGNYIDCPFFEDYYLWIRMLKRNCNFYNIQEPLVKVRSGLGMLYRRGGKKYICCILNFNKKIYKLGYINLFEYIRNIFIRIIISSVPNRIRKYFYQRYLRKEV